MISSPYVHAALRRSLYRHSHELFLEDKQHKAAQRVVEQMRAEFGTKLQLQDDEGK